MAEDTSPATEVDTFLADFGNADRKELERASSAVRSDQPAWEAAGGRVAEIVASLGLDEQKAQFCLKQRRFSREGSANPARGSPVRPLGSSGRDRGPAGWRQRQEDDLGLLFKPFDQLLRETPIPAPGEFCDKHPTVPQRFGRCQRCDDEKRYPPRW